MGIESNLDTPLAAAVRAAGSQSAYARFMGRSQASVYEALRNRRPMWDVDVLKAEKAWELSRSYLRPDLYPPSEGEADNTPAAIRSDNHRGADGSVSMEPLP